MDQEFLEIVEQFEHLSDLKKLEPVERSHQLGVFIRADDPSDNFKERALRFVGSLNRGEQDDGTIKADVFSVSRKHGLTPGVVFVENSQDLAKPEKLPESLKAKAEAAGYALVPVNKKKQPFEAYDVSSFEIRKVAYESGFSCCVILDQLNEEVTSRTN